MKKLVSLAAILILCSVACTKRTEREVSNTETTETTTVAVDTSAVDTAAVATATDAAKDAARDAAHQTGTAMEINASYPRLDLSDVNARHAHDAGVMISINTDAHSTGELGLMPFGIDVARRAWLTPNDVINCMSLASLKKFLAAKRGR